MKSKSIIELKEELHKVFSKFQDNGFKLKEIKIDFFFMEKFKYLSHINDKDGRRPDPEDASTR